MDIKKCFKCNIEWPLSNFYKHKAMKDGHVNKCKECNKKDVIENREKNISYYRQYDKLRHLKDERREYSHRQAKEWRENNREGSNEHQRRYRAKYPEKAKARYAVSNAIRDGKLKKKPCMVCGTQKVEGHHHDYSKPLHITWLCKAHHDAMHH